MPEFEPRAHESPARAEVRAAEVEAHLAAALLEDGPRRRFAAARRSIARRYAAWRHNFPSFAVLLESAEQRAEALAGNYATEGEATMRAWVEAQLDACDDRVAADRAERLVAWLEAFERVWGRAARQHAGLEALPPTARRRFGETLDDLLGRAREASEQRLRQGDLRQERRWPSWIRALASPFGRLLEVVRRFFFPAG